MTISLCCHIFMHGSALSAPSASQLDSRFSHPSIHPTIHPSSHPVSLLKLYPWSWQLKPRALSPGQTLGFHGNNSLFPTAMQLCFSGTHFLQLVFPPSLHFNDILLLQSPDPAICSHRNSAAAAAFSAIREINFDSLPLSLLAWLKNYRRLKKQPVN